ncbi:platelet endothelial aggregation receptor 1-like [Haliotis rubra]|uniref:platelet endothelial aggregation receptor 1-like n=1 Tax=Haliotis rubra TaxID=36100 RepID=UPI001EE51744|nr:platelet endothelial aggregation receptor 1-like [Haliotis rubra]
MFENIRSCDVSFQTGNIAYKKRTTSSQIYKSDWSADKAVDGNRNQKLAHDSCFRALDHPSVWTVDLGQQYRIHDVRIYNRDGYVWKIQSALLSLSNSSNSTSGVPCYTFPSNTATGNSVYDVICDGRGRYFTITHSWAELNLCEVEIYVCSQGSFGTDCSHFCHCSDGPCDGVSGICAGDCRPGWRGQNCSIECDKDHYGVNCNETCGSRNCATNTSSCDRLSGSCDTGCLPGWTAVDCTQECHQDHYGVNCNETCGNRNCAANTSSCDRHTGSCDNGCRPLDGLRWTVHRVNPKHKQLLYQDMFDRCFTIA